MDPETKDNLKTLLVILIILFSILFCIGLFPGGKPPVITNTPTNTVEYITPTFTKLPTLTPIPTIELTETVMVTEIFTPTLTYTLTPTKIIYPSNTPTPTRTLIPINPNRVWNNLKVEMPRGSNGNISVGGKNR